MGSNLFWKIMFFHGCVWYHWRGVLQQKINQLKFIQYNNEIIIDGHQSNSFYMCHTYVYIYTLFFFNRSFSFAVYCFYSDIQGMKKKKLKTIFPPSPEETDVQGTAYVV